MSFTFFQISCGGCPETEARLNQFLNANRVLSIDRRWVDLGENSFWAICIDYTENTSTGNSKKKSERIDYREVLPPEELNRRSRNRYKSKMKSLERDYLNDEISFGQLIARAESLTSFTRSANVRSWRFRTDLLQCLPVSGRGHQPGEPGR